MILARVMTERARVGRRGLCRPAQDDERTFFPSAADFCDVNMHRDFALSIGTHRRRDLRRLNRF